MSSKIFKNTFAIAMTVLFCSIMLITASTYEYYNALQAEQLEVSMSLASKAVNLEGIDFLDDLSFEDLRFTWIDTDGEVLYDSVADESSMENHGEREEVLEAIRTGTGEAERTSATLSEKTMYYAVLLDDGTVLRGAIMRHTATSLIMDEAGLISLVLLLAALVSWFLAKRMAKSIAEPLNKLDLDKPMKNDAYPEIYHLLSRIEKQHRQISEHEQELFHKNEEFSAITSGMSEGLILLNGNGYILSINRAAAKIFGINKSDYIGKDILTVNRSQVMQKLIEKVSKNEHAEGVLELGSRIYQLSANPVMSYNSQMGIALLIYDNTDREMAEQLRREFSANVSHELKTPLQSIMGYAELLESGLVKDEDKPRFVGNIRTEAQRLVTLINDIILVSQIDESDSLKMEEIDLYEIADEVLLNLENLAEKKNVSMILVGSSAKIMAVPRLIIEMTHNLCENAIKYNREGGKVEVRVDILEKSVKLSVKDSGIGIETAQQGRVFERFYRVDKSHSRQTGGSGLGLSIVKHTALYHKAELKLDSTVNVGTEISVNFPLT